MSSDPGRPSDSGTPQQLERIAADQRRLQLKVDEQNRMLRERQEHLLATVEQLQQREADAVRLAREAQEESRKLAEALSELRVAQGRLIRTEKLAAIGQLTAGISHELRNPLGAIRNAWFSIERRLRAAPQRDPRVERLAGIIDAELERCAAFIGQLLDFARERPAHRKPYPLQELISDTLQVVAAPSPSIEIIDSVPENLPVPNLDRDQFRQVVVNVVQNALEAVDRVTGKVEIMAREEDGWYTIEVRDNGAGIPEEVQAQIFEPLFTTKERGTGLGLPIVSSMVQRHEGSIELRSEPGQGTVFTITFPHREESAEGPLAEGGAADLRRT